MSTFILQLHFKKLLDSYFINRDESQIKIDGDGYNVLCACNKSRVRLWQHEYKSQEALVM